MTRSDRSYEEPYHDLQRVYMAVALRRLHITGKAQGEAREVFPEGTIKVSTEIAEIVGRLDRNEFAFCQEKSGEWVDVYKVPFRKIHLWVKIKLETDPETGEEVIVISFHQWDESRQT